MIIRNIISVLCLLVSVVFAEVLKEQYFLYAVATVAEDADFNNTICRRHLQEFRVAVQDRKLWALRMLDSSAQHDTGYLFGNTLWLGSFSHCRDISTRRSLIINEEHYLKDTAFPPFEIEFMTAALNHNNTMQFQYRIPINEYLHFGLCMPKICTPEELEQYLDRILEKKYLLMQQIYPVHMNVSGVKTLRSDQTNWKNDPMVIAAMIILISTLGLIIVGTWYDLFYYQPYLKLKQNMKIIPSDADTNTRILLQPTLAGRILLCYSIHTNVRNIFTVSERSEPNSMSLPFVHGLKAWFMFYIVLLHGVLYQNFNTDNPYTAYRMAEMFVNQILSNASYAVDTYFCLGGFLIAYIFYKMQKDRKPYRFISGSKMYCTMILHRYIRLTPAYAAIILTTYSLWLITEQEYPLIHRLKLERAEYICDKYWWRNLLYISTFYSREDMCMSWSWYLSDDMQFYVVNCLLLLLSTMYLKPILFILGSLPVVSIVIGSITSYVHKYVPTLEEQILTLEIMYDPFLMRMGPYFVGVIAGYYINKWNNSIPLNKNTITKLSYVSFFTAMFILHGVYTRDNLPNAYLAVYMGVSRTLWGVCIAWLIMTCVSGDAGFVNKFLSLKAWVPISRLTYCLYLVHPIIILMFGLTCEHGNHISYAFAIQLSVGTFAVSFVAALIISLMFESPYVLLLKLMLGKTRTNKD